MESSAHVNLDHELLTAPDIAALLRVPVSTVYELTRGGRLPCLRIGRAVRFSKEDLEAHLARPARHRRAVPPMSTDALAERIATAGIGLGTLGIQWAGGQRSTGGASSPSATCGCSRSCTTSATRRPPRWPPCSGVGSGPRHRSG